jgi:hypothetical protein
VVSYHFLFGKAEEFKAELVNEGNNSGGVKPEHNSAGAVNELVLYFSIIHRLPVFLLKFSISPNGAYLYALVLSYFSPKRQKSFYFNLLPGYCPLGGRPFAPRAKGTIPLFLHTLLPAPHSGKLVKFNP